MMAAQSCIALLPFLNEIRETKNWTIRFDTGRRTSSVLHHSIWRNNRAAMIRILEVW